MPDRYIGQREPRRVGLLVLFGIAIAALIAARYIASTLIDYQWWSELKQLDTWFGLLLYGTVPVALTAVLFWAFFYSAFLLGRRRAGDAALFGFISHKLLSRLALLASFLLAVLAAKATVDNWTVVRFVGGLRIVPAAGEYVDPIFGKPLHFYFFALPFYKLLLSFVLVAAVLSIVVFLAAANIDRLARNFPVGHGANDLDFEFASPTRHFDGKFIRVAGAILLLGIGVRIYFNRYDLLFEDHGAFLAGVDWVADHIVLPLQWALIVSAVLSAALVLARHARWATVFVLVLIVRFVLPTAISALYVHPNELALERPYIQHHIDATRSAFGLNNRVKEIQLEAKPEVPLDYDKHRALLSNVRLWDWRAFHDTLSQIQPLRPYQYHDTDVDRYVIDGQLRQVLLSARVLDIRQLGDAGTRWINPHLMYTHDYGLVMAESNRITPDGLPLLFIKNAPPEVTAHSLKLSQPDIYYGEVSHEPVYVNTGQQEFDYPSGSESVYTKYHGSGGIPLDSPLTRLSAAIEYGDPNLLLTSYITANSRMMIHRQILDRLNTLAGFLQWDDDPYIVLRADGRLVWLVDGYMVSDAHPYSREIEDTGRYIRNSVKATVDAYTGEVSIYLFDPSDTLIQAYAQLFPKLFRPMSQMPPDIRAHARYPETLFRAQAEIYRAFHMRDPEAFYNRADYWDLARTPSSQDEGGSAAVSPTYVVASLPNANDAEFMLMTQFTPANKNNLIGQLVARCDGEHLGEIVFEQLSKQNIIFGPIQIDARINQDQNISKDLTLWNQQGSKVVRGQTLVLPIENSFLYVEPIYIQASQASMPQLKKVALAMGNRLAYADTYEQALTQLIAQVGGSEATLPAAPVLNQPRQPSPAAPSDEKAAQTLREIRDHLTRYRELSSQGKWEEAGRELEAIQSLVK